MAKIFEFMSLSFAGMAVGLVFVGEGWFETFTMISFGVVALLLYIGSDMLSRLEQLEAEKEETEARRASERLAIRANERKNAIANRRMLKNL